MLTRRTLDPMDAGMLAEESNLYLLSNPVGAIMPNTTPSDGFLQRRFSHKPAQTSAKRTIHVLVGGRRPFCAMKADEER